MSDTNLKRITISPEICHGKPTVRGSRIMVESILEYLAAGDSIEDILSEFTTLEREDVLAAIAYANTVVKTKNISHKVAS